MEKSPWGNGIQSRAEQREMKRMAILRVAAKAFNTAGFHKTTLTDLAQALHVTKPTLYYYVKNKEDILAGILEMAMVQLREVIQSAPDPAATGYERLAHFFTQYAAVMTDDFGASLILTRINALNSNFRQLYHEASREVFLAVQAMIRQGIADGSIAACNPKYAASALLGTVNETVYWYLMDGKESPAEAAVSFLAVFAQGLQPRQVDT